MGRLKIEAQRLLSLSIAPNTHKAYGTAWVSYENMCREMGRVALLPVSKINIIDFIYPIYLYKESRLLLSALIFQAYLIFTNVKDLMIQLIVLLCKKK